MPKKIQVVGGDLFLIAAKELGDARQWNRIAAANGLWDPQIVGVMTLTIPDPAPNLIALEPNLGGGVLGAPG